MILWEFLSLVVGCVPLVNIKSVTLLLFNIEFCVCYGGESTLANLMIILYLAYYLFLASRCIVLFMQITSYSICGIIAFRI